MQNNNDKLLTKLFFNMLPVQILIFAMGYVTSLVNGAVAGRFIEATAVGVIGLFYPMVQILSAVGSILLGGTAVVCGKYMGQGDLEKTKGVFSLNLTLTCIFGAAITVLCLILPNQIASLLGAPANLNADLARYIMGYAIGILPMLISQQLASFLQMERQNTRGYIGIAGMIVTNVSLDIVFVCVMGMGIFGLALATSIGNLVYFLLLIPYYFTKKAQLRFSIKNILWEETGNLIKIGFPGALLIFCCAARGMVINRVLLRYAGEDGLSALSGFNLICGFYIAFCLGCGSMVRMLIAIFIGEEDKESMKKTLKLVFTKGMAMAVALAAAAAIFSGPLTSIFFPDKTSNVYHLAHQLFLIYGLCIPLVLICQVLTNYMQAMERNLFVNVQSVFDGFFSMVVPSLLLAPALGALGVWLANPIGMILTILLVPIYCTICWQHIPRSLDEWMLLDKDFGVSEKDALNIAIDNLSDVSKASSVIQQFCEDHGMGKRASYYSALSLEEMAGNVINHGFSADKKRHLLNATTVFKDGDIVLRIKDDCVPFNPVEMAQMSSEDGDMGGLGIRMVRSLSDDVTYQNMLGLNVLTITVKEEDLLKNEAADYLLEKRLKELSPELHANFKNTVFAIQKVLSRYRLLFPEYTDHSELHSLTVIDSCNRLIGKEQIEKLNADEIHILLSACYLHDVGMGIGEKDYDEFKDRLGEKEFFEKNPEATRADFVRIYHNEFSSFLIDKYAGLLEFPSKEHVFAIKQVARGHRKTDLFDESEYPAALALPNGNTVCLPYLAALVRLADEVDVVATRNPMVLYDISTLTDANEIIENKKVEAIKTMTMTKDSFILACETDEEEIFNDILAMTGKMQNTLDYCRKVVEERTAFTISQKKVILKRI